jgi:hypothetical protein
VWGSGAADVYAVGDGGVILHSTGNGSWVPQVSHTTARLYGACGTGSAVGAGGAAVHFH